MTGRAHHSRVTHGRRASSTRSIFSASAGRSCGVVPILVAPFAGPFGLTFTFADPDGYAVTIHG
jgi:hypothetical protein